MNKTVWILNHYAGNMFLTGGGRHYYLAKYLKENGFDPIVFCSNYDHFTHEKCADNNELWTEKQEEATGILYVFVKTCSYTDNGIKRVENMVDFYQNVIKVGKQYAALNCLPAVIYASSVHPLTLVAGIRLAKHFHIKCISEVRDLWPESIVAYSSRWTRTNPLMRILYAGEKWIYKKSDYVIMTWPGGYDYIINQGWQNEIPESKVIHISNGVDLDSYLRNIHENPYEDADLSNKEFKSFIYTGSVRMVNNLAMLVLSARKLEEMGNKTARILVFGDGDDLSSLKKEAENLNNIIFKGRVPKQSVPSILSQGYVSILHNSSTELNQYGQSQNKFFEYLAAGRPILMTYTAGHSVIKSFECGLELDLQTPETIAKAIDSLCSLSDNEYQALCNNAVKAAEEYDYRRLTEKLIDVIQSVLN